MFNGEFHPTSTCLARKKRHIIVAVLHPLSMGQFHQRAAFMLAGPKNTKQHWWLDCLFGAFGICGSKSFSKNVDEIDTWGKFHQHSTISFIACRSQKSKKTIKGQGQFHQPFGVKRRWA